MAAADTIFALSSGQGRSGISVFRVSGSGAENAIRHLTGQPLPEARKAVLRRFMRDQDVIDHGLLLWFPAPASFTGEDCVEFHSHGGRAVAEAMLAALAAIPGLRPAEPGEFTRRAVEHGRLDLTRAEALADLIDAETEGQRRQALRQYDGAMEAFCEDWRTRLIAAGAWTEAAIDFADEELPDDVQARARQALREILLEIQSYVSRSVYGEAIREGVRLTVIGLPNAGKSSLVNAIARQDVAIVSEIAGTTRDVIEVRLNLGGFLVLVADTAGLRTSNDTIEGEGVRRALSRAQSSDLVLLLLDGTTGLAPDLPGLKPDLVVWNKADRPWPEDHAGLRLSLRTGEGLEAVLDAIAGLVRERVAQSEEAPPITRTRHRYALKEAADALTRALEAQEPELMAEDIRLATRAIGRITGRVDVEELLDVIFRDFCIGK